MNARRSAIFKTLSLQLLAAVSFDRANITTAFQVGSCTWRGRSRTTEKQMTVYLKGDSDETASDQVKVAMKSKLVVNDLINVKGILFDIDGTLADSWKLGFDATQVVLQKNGIDPITVDTYHDGTKFSTPHRLARHAGYFPDDEDDTSFRTMGEKMAKEFDEYYVNLVSKRTHFLLSERVAVSF
jgi:hypothetical protein